MPSVTLTDLALKRLPPKPDGQVETFDRKIAGLGVRVSPGGTKAFFLSYRIAGRSRRLALGRYPALGLAEARDRALEALRQIAQGIDPANVKRVARDSYQSRLFPTVLDDFIESHAKRMTRSWHEAERLLRKEFARPWHKLPIDQITKHTINAVIDEIVKRGAPSAANHAFADIRRFFNWCVERGYLDHAPCAGMKAPCKVASRDRVLTDEELLRIWLAATKIGWPTAPFIQLLILTAQRRSEVARLRWCHLDLEQGLWTQPAEENKSGRIHDVPLPPLAIDILRSLPCLHDALVFPARCKDTPISGHAQRKRRLDALSGIKDWRLHDLRRTAASGMAALGVAPHVIELTLNHQSGTLSEFARIYNRHRYLSERREALELWSRHVEALIREASNSTHKEPRL